MAKRSKNAKRKTPRGRTLSTYDNYLGRSQTGSKKERPVVVIEANAKNELAVVSLSTRAGKNRTRLRGYQQDQSYFKHFVEIEDDEGKSIKVNEKFRENHSRHDVPPRLMDEINDKLFCHSKPASENRKKMEYFRKRK